MRWPSTCTVLQKWSNVSYSERLKSTYRNSWRNGIMLHTFGRSITLTTLHMTKWRRNAHRNLAAVQWQRRRAPAAGYRRLWHVVRPSLRFLNCAGPILCQSCRVWFLCETSLSVFDLERSIRWSVELLCMLYASDHPNAQGRIKALGGHRPKIFYAYIYIRGNSHHSFPL